MQSEQINELAKALSKAQGQMKSAIKDANNPFFKSKYANLTSVWEACRDPLSTNGLSVMQTVEGEKDAMILVTTLAHESGQWIKSKLPMLMQKQDPQAMGSSMSYSRRYALSAICGITTDDEDDDGEKAMARDKINKKELAEIEKVLAECDPAYVQKVILHLKKLGVDSFSGITQALFPSVMAAAIKNKEENLQKKTTQGIEEKKELSHENTNS